MQGGADALDRVVHTRLARDFQAQPACDVIDDSRIQRKAASVDGVDELPGSLFGRWCTAPKKERLEPVHVQADSQQPVVRGCRKADRWSLHVPRRRLVLAARPARPKTEAILETSDTSPDQEALADQLAYQALNLAHCASV